LKKLKSVLKNKSFWFAEYVFISVFREALLNSNSFKEYDYKLHINKLKKENKKLKKENKKLNKKLKKVKQLNKSLINSNSWKITKPIRSIKNKLKK